MSLTQEIKDFALDLGYCAVGITTAEPFVSAAEQLELRREAYSWLIDGRLKMLDCTTPTNIMPSAKSIIIVAYDYAREGLPPGAGRQTRPALPGSRSYNAPRNRINGARRNLFKDFLEGKG